jgi:hypothetical protein
MNIIRMVSTFYIAVPRCCDVVLDEGSVDAI